jgi:ABC-2 type transport system permease protein
MVALYIAFKDTLTRFRDRNGIIMMLLAPLVLAAVIGAAFSGLSNQPEDVPLALVDADRTPASAAFVAGLRGVESEGLIALTEMDSPEAAREAARTGAVRGAAILPVGFAKDIQSGRAEVQVWTDPTSTVGAAVAREAVAGVAAGFNARLTGAPLPAEPVQPDNPFANESALAYFAPSMAVLILMFTLFDAASSLLEEERQGTLARMMIAPVRFAPLLLGKLLGVFLTGALQLTALIIASRLLFGLSWGPIAGVALMVVSVALAAAALGACIVAFSRNEQQAGIASAAIAMLFGILGGSFFNAAAYPAWMQPLSRLTLNRWALDGFTDLTRRGLGASAVLPEAGVLLAAAAVFGTIALLRLPRRFVR